MTATKTRPRWGGLVAPEPRHIDFVRRTVSVEETIVEISRMDSPTASTHRHPARVAGPKKGRRTCLGARVSCLTRTRTDLGGGVTAGTSRTAVWPCQPHRAMA